MLLPTLIDISPQSSPLQSADHVGFHVFGASHSLEGIWRRAGADHSCQGCDSWSRAGTLMAPCMGALLRGAEAERSLADHAKSDPVLAPCNVSLLQALGAALALPGPRVRILQLGWQPALKILVWRHLEAAHGLRDPKEVRRLYWAPCVHVLLHLAP